MKRKPAYFEPIRLKAARRWHQLEQDPELAGPWHLLFKQVQSPRHVLSELLQNADDAGATEASVRIENQVFVFEHNGEDFTRGTPRIFVSIWLLEQENSAYDRISRDRIQEHVQSGRLRRTFHADARCKL